jgi:hypothetical protein
MPKFFVAVELLLVVAATTTLADEKPKPGFAKKDGLSLTVALDKKVYASTDEIKLSFTIKNVTDKDMFIGDGFLAPNYHEAGPGRHFEVQITAEKKSPLYFWTGMATEGEASGARKVFKLEPGKTYEGSIRISAGAGKDEKRAEQPHGQRGGSLEDKKTRKGHVLGKDGQKYTVALLYQVNPKSHGVWEPPAEFKDELLWKGEITCSPVEFEVRQK